MAKTIKIDNIDYKIKDYLEAPDMVGLNISKLFSLVDKMQGTDSTLIIGLMIENMDVLTKLVERLIINPKMKNKKLATILKFISQPELMKSFTESFEGLDIIMGGTEKKE